IMVPKKTGAGYEIPAQLAPVARVREHVNLITNLTASATGDFRNTVSYENANSPNPPEISPVELYTRLYGADFQDPNSPTFTPSARVMARRSVLSGVMGEIQSLQKSVGASDRQRLDEYFTGLRHLEKQFDQQLTKPEPIAACHAPPSLRGDPKMGVDVEMVQTRHRLLTDLMVMAVACDQTRVFNMAYSNAQANTVKEGYEKPHHTTTHEEPIDEKLGYQPNHAYFVEAFSKVKEGGGTLLDNMLIYANTDHGDARVHALDQLVSFTAGRAGGRVKTGLHVNANGSGVTRVGYTALRVMGLELPAWGVKSNRTSSPFNEIVA
ncbi:MAG: DUF1552 domain-containing protein, partial [Proteobacteria bacterium]